MREFASRLGPLIRRRPPVGAGQSLSVPLQSRVLCADTPAAVPPLRPRVDIPVRDPSPDEDARRSLLQRGRHLARQDAWDTLSREICEADRARRMTPGLRPVAEILAEGACEDALCAARAAIQRGEPRQARAAIAALEANRDETPDCGALAYVIATAHVASARAWRGASKVAELAPQRRGGYERNMQAAAALADQFDPFALDSGLWAALRCAVLEADPTPAQRVCDDYEDLLDLHPHCPDHMRAMGRDLLPARFGTFEVLETQSRRAAMRLRDVWGMGAYTWIWIGAMESDAQAYRRVDTALFREGLRDIADRHPDQHMINRLAAFTGVTLPAPGGSGRGNTLAADFDWLAGERLTELHPMVWAEAKAPGQTPGATADAARLADRGRARALSTIAERFADRLGQSGRLVFTETGLRCG